MGLNLRRKFSDDDKIKILQEGYINISSANFMADWDNLPKCIKPAINNVIAEARQYSKASADYYGYKLIAKTGAYGGTVFVYVLNDTKALYPSERVLKN